MPDLMKRHKHLTLDDRIEIQECLNRGMTFKATAARVGKDQTTISKEVKKHISVGSSVLKHLDKDGNQKAPPICPKHLKAPFVCNGCERKNVRCQYVKQYYSARVAQKEYEELLSEAREGIPLRHEEFYEIDNVITSGVKQGQHLYHIMQSNELGVSKSTVYRHLNRGYLSVSPVEFPRVVKFKARVQRRGEYVPKSAKIGRTYLDFLNHIEMNGIPSWVEMDTVIGRMGGKVILTLDFTFCNFMVGILLDNKTSAEMAMRITLLKERFAERKVRFSDVLPVILTDNGGEFSDVFAFENDLTGEKETMLFFCDPMQSSQKPKVEKNHTMFRDIVPRGSSFDDFTQDTVNYIFSHINSVKRKSLNGKTPFEMFSFAFGEKITEIFGILPISAKYVCQSPRLLRSINL